MSSYSLYRRIYYNDTDAGGVVYHTNYLNYMEHARTEYFRSIGFGHQFMAEECQIMFVVSELTTKYLAPARLGEEIEVVAAVARNTSVKVIFEHYVWLLDERRERLHKLCEAQVQVVCVDTQYFKPTRIPHIIEERIVRDS